MRNALAVCLLAVAAAAHAADRPCTKADASNAEKAIDRINTWPQLYKAWQDWRQCDGEAAVADVYTDALLRLAVTWKHVDGLATPMKNDPQYREFIYKHLKSDAAKDDRESVYSRARKDCPSSLDAFCTEMGDTIRAAIEADDAKAKAKAAPAAAPAPAATPAPAAPAAAPAPAPDKK